MDNKALVFELTDSCEYQPLLSGIPQTYGMRAGRVYLKPGESCGEHTTGEHEETLVFLEGKGEAVINRERREAVGAGKVSYIPPRTIHNIENTSDDVLVYIYCVAPITE
jgi:mannose-6-phosphate isomerase-like protein (cupin superfamily)